MVTGYQKLVVGCGEEEEEEDDDEEEKEEEEEEEHLGGLSQALTRVTGSLTLASWPLTLTSEIL